MKRTYHHIMFLKFSYSTEKSRSLNSDIERPCPHAPLSDGVEMDI